MSFLVEHLQAKPEMVPCNIAACAVLEALGVAITSFTAFMANSRPSATHFRTSLQCLQLPFTTPRIRYLFIRRELSLEKVLAPEQK